MLISSWNVNSVRARINNILEYLKKSKNLKKLDTTQRFLGKKVIMVSLLYLKLIFQILIQI